MGYIRSSVLDFRVSVIRAYARQARCMPGFRGFRVAPGLGEPFEKRASGFTGLLLRNLN